MQNALINTETLKTKTKKGLCNDLGGFVAYLPVFLSYSPLLNVGDFSTMATMKYAWGDRVDEYLVMAVEKGILLKTKFNGLYLYAPYFAEQGETKVFHMSEELWAVAPDFNLDRQTRWIKEADREGDFPQFLQLLSKELFDKERRKKPVAQALALWKKGEGITAPQMEEGLGNSKSNSNSNCKGNGESNAVTITLEENSNGKEWYREFLEEWAKQYHRSLEELKTYFRKPYFEEAEPKPTKEDIERLYCMIPKGQECEKFKKLFEDVLNRTEEPLNPTSSEDREPLPSPLHS